MFLTLDKFLSYFPNIIISKSRFTRTFKIMYKTPITLHELFSLKYNSVIKDKNDRRYINRQLIIDYFYDIIVINRHKYLSLWHAAYFGTKKIMDYKWEGIDLHMPGSIDSYEIISTQKNDGSKHMIRSLFYMELLHYTKISNSVKSHVSFWESLINMYNKLELEDRFFCASSIDLMLRSKDTKREAMSGIPEPNYNAMFYLYQQYQPKASIFNCYTIKWMLEEIFPMTNNNPKTLYSPVLSWGSYIPAFMHIPSYEHYVGVDVMKSVCDKIKLFGEYYINELGTNNKKIDIINSASEKLPLSFIKKYKNYFDTIIVCPPYYDMEIYHEGDQSINNYTSYEEWLTGYWENTVKICASIAKKGCVMGVIINDYYNLKGVHYPLTKDFDRIMRKYFKFITIYYLQNRVSPLRVNNKDRLERLFLYHV